MLNQMSIVGRLINDIHVKQLEDGTRVSNITLAVQRSYENAYGIYEADLINCSLYNSMAENTAIHCKKGDIVGIKGHIKPREVKIENIKHSEVELVADKITFLSYSKENEIC